MERFLCLVRCWLIAYTDDGQTISQPAIDWDCSVPFIDWD